MADKTKFDDTISPLGGEHSDLDPFAELKRIMGLDRQEPVKQAESAPVSEGEFIESLSGAEPEIAPAVAEVHAEVAKRIASADQPAEGLSDDFGIDLERELMGEFATAEVSASEPVSGISVQPHAVVENTAELDAAFADEVGSLEAAFSDQPQSRAELDADLDELNVVFSATDADAFDDGEVAEEELVEAVAADKSIQPAAMSLDADDLDFGDLDFGDIDSAIAKEMDQALSAGFGSESAAKAANGAPVQSKAADGLADVDMDFDNALDWSALDAPRADVRASATRVSALDNADELLAALDAAAKNTTNEPGAAAKSAASNEDPFATLAKMSDQYQSRDNQYDWRQPVRNTQPKAAAPEVETTEMFDQAFSMTDDLELPDVRYDEPTQAASEIDLEFDNLLNEMSRAEPVRPVHTAPEAPRYDQRETVAPRANDGFDDFDSMFAQPVPQAAQPAQRAQPQQDYQAQDDHDLGDFDFDDQDFDDQEPVQQSAYRSHDGRGRGGRGMMIAAIVGGVALLGGIGAMAMSWTGDIGAPALVKADSSPTKIRPENPGGSSLPNQDSAVYDTVSRSGSPQPTQERLVSATEDPIALPQPDDSEVDEVAALTKDEDRIAPTEADASAAEDPLAVAPRKVRTMIVKPDGSLVPADVPAEEPAAAASAEPSVEDIASAPVGEPEQITTGATQPTPAVEPETVAAVAPAPGGWAVQIASQPSEDGANKSMKSMTQKYSGVIGDRGAHIVKADVPGKGTYWRVRVAANSRDDAVSLCSNLKSAGGSCFVTR